MNLDLVRDDSGLVVFTIDGARQWQVMWRGQLVGQRFTQRVEAVTYFYKLVSELEPNLRT